MSCLTYFITLPSLRPYDRRCYLVIDVNVYLTFYKKYTAKNFELYLVVSKKAVSLQRSNKNNKDKNNDTQLAKESHYFSKHYSTLGTG